MEIEDNYLDENNIFDEKECHFEAKKSKINVIYNGYKLIIDFKELMISDLEKKIDQNEESVKKLESCNAETLRNSLHKTVSTAQRIKEMEWVISNEKKIEVIKNRISRIKNRLNNCL